MYNFFLFQIVTAGRGENSSRPSSRHSKQIIACFSIMRWLGNYSKSEIRNVSQSKNNNPERTLHFYLLSYCIEKRAVRGIFCPLFSTICASASSRMRLGDCGVYTVMSESIEIWSFFLIRIVSIMKIVSNVGDM